MFNFACLLITCVTLAGCAPSAGEAASLTGSVKYDGKPVQKGAFRLSAEDGTPGMGGLGQIQDGNFSIPASVGLKAGKYLVIILGFKETGRMFVPDVGMPERKEEVQFIPKKYNDNSQLHLDLNPGENTKDFDLVK